MEFRDQQALLITDRSVIVFDLSTGRIQHTFPREDESPMPLFWPDALTLWQLSADQRVINLINGEVIATLPAYPSQVYDITHCAQVVWLYPCDPSKLPITMTFFYRWFEYLNLVTWSPAGDRLLMTLSSEGPIFGDSDHLMVFWDLLQGRAITVRVSYLGGVLTAEFNHAGDLLLVGYNDYVSGGLMNIALYDEVIDPFTGNVLKRLETGFDPISAITFTPDDRLLLTYSDTLRVWGAVP